MQVVTFRAVVASGVPWKWLQIVFNFSYSLGDRIEVCCFHIDGCLAIFAVETPEKKRANDNCAIY